MVTPYLIHNLRFKTVTKRIVNKQVCTLMCYASISEDIIPHRKRRGSFIGIKKCIRYSLLHSKNQMDYQFLKSK